MCVEQANRTSSVCMTKEDDFNKSPPQIIFLKPHPRPFVREGCFDL